MPRPPRSPAALVRPAETPRFPNEALELLVAHLETAGGTVLSPYLLSAGSKAMAVLAGDPPLPLAAHRCPMLAVVRRYPGITQAELARCLGIERVTAGKKVKDALADGLVERRDHGTDQRAVALYLTARGQQMLDEIARTGPAREEKLAAALSGAETRELQRLLRKLLAG